MGKNKNSGSFCIADDCESSVTMRVKCRRGQLIAAIAVLILCSTLVNFTLLHKHWRELASGDYALVDTSRFSLNFQFPHFAGGGGESPTNGEKGGKGKGRPRRGNIQPKPESLSPNATFSACLLIKDDNDILNEWIAYHYFALKLRHLIVAVDPLSRQSPSLILQRWSNLTDLVTVEWSDPDYMPDTFLEEGRPPRKYIMKQSDFKGDMTLSHTALMEVSNHRYRQRVFLGQCMKKHRELGNSWVIHIDTDEYVVASKLLRQMHPGYLVIPPMDQPGSALSLLQQVVNKTSKLINYPCISMLRVLFGSVEIPQENRDQNVPADFNSSAFETLRWRYHALPHNMSLNGNPKVIVDVAAIPETYLPDVVFSIHRPVVEFCSKNNDLSFTNFRKQPIAVNHYLGSWERYSGRQDKRRSRANYDAKADQQRGRDDGMQLWLKGFVQDMGAAKSIELLGKDYLSKGERGVGQLVRGMDASLSKRGGETENPLRNASLIRLEKLLRNGNSTSPPPPSKTTTASS